MSQGEPRWQFLRQAMQAVWAKSADQIINFQKCRWSDYSDGNVFKALGQKDACQVESRSSSESQPMSFSCKRSSLLRTFRSPKNLRRRDPPAVSSNGITLVVHCMRRAKINPQGQICEYQNSYARDRGLIFMGEFLFDVCKLHEVYSTTVGIVFL